MFRDVVRYKLFTICSLLATVAILAQPVMAEDSEGAELISSVAIVHTPPFEGPELPAPGKPIEIVAQLANSQDAKNLMRLMLVRDGQLTQVPLTKSYLNAYDQPEYVFRTNAPITEMRYFFILPASADTPSPTFSKQFHLRRPCMPRVSLTELPKEGSADGEERLNALVANANALEREVIAYDQAVVILKELLTEIGGGK